MVPLWVPILEILWWGFVLYLALHLVWELVQLRRERRKGD